MSNAELAFLCTYFGVLVVLSVYGAHRYWMAYLYLKHKYAHPTPPAPLEALPTVTVQLPMFNELYVAERLIDTVCGLEYPRRLLQVQVLDDSTDETQGVARARVEHWAAQGVNIVYVRRDNRVGFKAGALEHGLASATGELVAVFDADFVPPADFLLKTVPHFADRGVGMVQVRWSHLNRRASALTQVQTVMLDGHFIIEQAARAGSSAFFNFNGTAGVWRRQTIIDAGGWQHDTLTEDMDLSYRAQLAGWRFVYLPHVEAPAELPEGMNAFKTQQHRWAKGSIQTALKLLPRILASDLPFRHKAEAFFHLSNNVAYVGLMLMALMMPFALGMLSGNSAYTTLLIDVPIFLSASASVGFFYGLTLVEMGPTWWERLKYVPCLMAMGMGLSINQSRAVLEALLDAPSDFARTPKTGNGGVGASRPAYRLKASWVSAVELAFVAYYAGAIVLAVQHEEYGSLPFLFLFFSGFAYVAFTSLLENVKLSHLLAGLPEKASSAG